VTKALEVRQVGRRVIESTLLASLQDDGTVAVLYGREELSLLISVLAGREPSSVRAARQMARDLEQLYEEAFGDCDRSRK